VSSTYIWRPPIEVGRATERAYALVKERLVFGGYKGGQRIPVDELRNELGVSKQPVTEAMRILAAEGFVQIVPQVGCRVVTFEHRDMLDFFQLFAAIEGTAARLAAERATPEQVEELRAVSSEIGRLLPRPEVERARGYLVLNREFHSVVHGMSGTDIVGRIGSSMYDRSDFFVNSLSAHLPHGPALADRHADHERIVAAIGAGDQSAAERAASDHILGTVAVIEAALERDRTQVA
jgi:DNA-binding GntR family transcriptional regulator